jgi:hypothetical protein
VEVRVGFSCHTFTRACGDADLPEQRYSAAREARTFCPDRYALSHLLPDIVRGLGGRKCFYAKRQNYFTVELPAQLPPGHEYRIFFHVRAVDEAGTVLLFVQSAYAVPRDSGPHGRREKKVGFNVLVNLALQGRRPAPPP